MRFYHSNVESHAEKHGGNRRFECESYKQKKKQKTINYAIPKLCHGIICMTLIIRRGLVLNRHEKLKRRLVSKNFVACALSGCFPTPYFVRPKWGLRPGPVDFFLGTFHGSLGVLSYANVTRRKAVNGCSMLPPHSGIGQPGNPSKTSLHHLPANETIPRNNTRERIG